MKGDINKWHCGSSHACTPENIMRYVNKVQLTWDSLQKIWAPSCSICWTKIVRRSIRTLNFLINKAYLLERTTGMGQVHRNIFFSIGSTCTKGTLIMLGIGTIDYDNSNIQHQKYLKKMQNKSSQSIPAAISWQKLI